MNATIEMIDAAMVEMANITPPLRRSECERLIRAALSAMEKQEPVCAVGSHWNSGGGFDVLNFTKQPPAGTKLYMEPKESPLAKPSFAEWCATNWNGAPSANAMDAYNEAIGGQQP